MSKHCACERQRSVSASGRANGQGVREHRKAGKQDNPGEGEGRGEPVGGADTVAAVLGGHREGGFDSVC
jgi:hypothetical protein